MLTVALPQFRPRKGDLSANLDRIAELVAQAAALRPAPQLVVFAETVTSGYFVEGGVRELALSADALAAALDERLHALAPDLPALDVILGFYERDNGTLYNGAACIALGGGHAAEVRHVHRKNFLPTYALFDEERFVDRGYGVQAFDTSWGRVAILVCEDAWHSLTATIAALDGAQVVCVLAAAPARGSAPRDDKVPGPGSVERWERLIRDIADEHGVFCVLVNLVGSEGRPDVPGRVARSGTARRRTRASAGVRGGAGHGHARPRRHRAGAVGPAAAFGPARGAAVLAARARSGARVRSEGGGGNCFHHRGAQRAQRGAGRRHRSPERKPRG